MLHTKRLIERVVQGVDAYQLVNEMAAHHDVKDWLRHPTKTFKGPNGNEVIGYEWKSMEGQDKNGNFAWVSDWSRSETCDICGRQIVYIFYVRDNANGGTVICGGDDMNQVLGYPKQIMKSQLDKIALNVTHSPDAKHKKLIGLDDKKIKDVRDSIEEFAEDDVLSAILKFRSFSSEDKQKIKDYFIAGNAYRVSPVNHVPVTYLYNKSTKKILVDLSAKDSVNIYRKLGYRVLRRDKPTDMAILSASMK